MTPPAHFTPVPLDQAYRLLNHGPTVLVSSAYQGRHNVMAAAWSCPLDYAPPLGKVCVTRAVRGVDFAG